MNSHLEDVRGRDRMGGQQPDGEQGHDGAHKEFESENTEKVDFSEFRVWIVFDIIRTRQIDC